MTSNIETILNNLELIYNRMDSINNITSQIATEQKLKKEQEYKPYTLCHYAKNIPCHW